MDKCREAFEKKFPIPAHWIEFDENRNKYYCPYVADAKASEYQEMWEVWQSRQAEVEQLKCENKKIHGREIKKFEENLILKAEIEEKDKRIEELQAKVDAVEHVLGCAMIAPKEVFQYADRIGRALRGEHE